MWEYIPMLKNLPPLHKMLKHYAGKFNEGISGMIPILLLPCRRHKHARGSKYLTCKYKS